MADNLLRWQSAQREVATVARLPWQRIQPAFAARRILLMAPSREKSKPDSSSAPDQPPAMRSACETTSLLPQAESLNRPLLRPPASFAAGSLPLYPDGSLRVERD